MASPLASAQRLIRFGVFELDVRSGELRKAGIRLSFQDQPLKVLKLLLERPGELVTREELRAQLWPSDTFVGFEHGLNAAVGRLRETLGDSADSPRFIETVPRRGYRFIGTVVGDGTGTLPGSQVGPSNEPVPVARAHLRLAVATLLLAIACVTAFLVTSKSDSAATDTAVPVPAFTKLTANPSELPVYAQSISPDGKYLAYCDRIGMHVQVIDTGEAQLLADTAGMEVLGWSDDGTRIRALEADGPTQAVWDVSLVGSARRRTGLVWPEGGVSLAPDASCFLRVTKDHELRVEPVHGAPRGVARLGNDDVIVAAVWAPDAQRVFFLRRTVTGTKVTTTIETFALSGGQPSVVFRAVPGQVIRVIGPPDKHGRLIAFIGQLGHPNDINIWEIRADLQTGALVGEPRRLTDWREMGCHQITQSADGTRVALLTTWHQSDVYVAAFDQQAARLAPPRRLTMSDFEDYPAAWTPDNRSVIFSSNQSVREWDIYKQDIDSKDAQLLVSGDGAKNHPSVTGDGRWILFIQSAWPAPSWDIYPPTRVMRAPIDGGIAEEIYESPGWAVPQCSLSGGCVVWDERGDEAVVSVLDPMRGKGAELATFPASGGGSILSDGTGMASIVPERQPHNHIRIVSFRGKPAQDILVERANELERLDPTPDGMGWLSVNHTTDHDELLYITRDGKSHVLWAPDRTGVVAAIPSRDLKHLAIWTNTRTGNTWMMSDFQK